MFNTCQVDLDGSEKSVRITAIDDVHWVKAKNALNEAIIVEKMEIPSDADIMSDSDDFQSFKEKYEKEGKLKIKLETSNDMKSKAVKLVGTKDAVKETRCETQKFIASKKIKKQPVTASNPTSKYR